MKIKKKKMINYLITSYDIRVLVERENYLNQYGTKCDDLDNYIESQRDGYTPFEIAGYYLKEYGIDNAFGAWWQNLMNYLDRHNSESKTEKSDKAVTMLLANLSNLY